MNALFGIFVRDGRPLHTSLLETLKASTISAVGGVCNLWVGEGIGLGWTQEISSSEIHASSIVQTYSPDGVMFAAAGRVDNRLELGRLLQVPEAELHSMSDGAVLRRAYLKWREGCSVRIFGDWSFAAWHPDERRLVLSRDHHGNTPLYYYLDQQVFAFASSRRALLALNLAPVQLDELYLAQYLTSWMGFHGERTLHSPIRRLPPAHYLVVTQKSCTVEQYWRLEDAPELLFPDRRDYVDAFLPLFDEAVRCRLNDAGTVACTMSGGLDSSSVAVTAARFLGTDGGRLTTFTSVPFFDTSRYLTSRFGDEFPYAQATARYAGNIDLNPRSSIEISPISAIRRALQINADLSYGASNLYWILDLQHAARERGCNVFMTGALGNGGISWDGDIFSQSWPVIWRQLGWRKLAGTLQQRLKDRLKLALPIGIVASLRQQRMDQQEWLRTSAIHPDFARRLHLLEEMLHDPEMLPPRSPRQRRMRYFMPGRSMGGAYAAEIAGANGLEVRDPTADARVLAFTCSVPDRIFMDPQTGMDRWLIREAMKGRLPDEVRLNRNMGRQAGDMVPRLRACAAEVETVLDELARGPAAEYVDVGYMRQVWRLAQTEDTHESFLKTSMVLPRGIMAGLFVNQFYA